MMSRAEYVKEWAKKAKEKDPDKFRKEQLKRSKKYYRKHRVLCLERAATYRKENP